MPGKLVMSSFILSVRCLIVDSGASPKTVTLRTWRRRVTSRTIGSSASLGKVEIRSTSAFTSSRSSCKSQSFITSMVTLANDSLATESIRLMPANPATFSSILRTMASSTSAGEAPGYSMVMEIMSSEVSGNISSLVVSPVTAPANKRKSISRLAAT